MLHHINIKPALLLMLLLPWLAAAQDIDPMSHRGVQFAAQGTDFWVCFPRTLRGLSGNESRIYVVSERPCTVTVTNDYLGYSQTFNVLDRRSSNASDNYFRIPFEYTRILDTVPYQYSSSTGIGRQIPVPHHNYEGCAGDRPQPRGFHVTSTDTISLFIVVASTHGAGCAVLPTEMLRDEYIAQPPIVNHHHYQGYGDPIFLPLFLPGMASVDIVAVDDSTVVDITVTDRDWLNRYPGDTITVTLRRGELFHLSAGEIAEKYHPLTAPYYDTTDFLNESPLAQPVPVPRHAFSGGTAMRDTFSVDIAGTRIKARDCKRIAVFESSGICGYGLRGTVFYETMKLDQAMPIHFAGKEYLVPNEHHPIRFTAIDSATTVQIVDAAHPDVGPRSLVIPAGKTDWWECDPGEGPYYITSDHPLLVKWTGDGLGYLVPTRWWHWGRILYGTPTKVDDDENRWTCREQLHIFARTADISAFSVDSYRIQSDFTPITGTPYSYAFFDKEHSFNSEGTHTITTNRTTPFSAYIKSHGFLSSFIPLPHLQPGGVTLTANGRLTDSIPPDTLWCVFDPVTFQARNQRPCDSLFYHFGDGTGASFSYADTGFSRPITHLFPAPGVYTVQAVFTYEYDSCFTRRPDTVSYTLDLRGHLDTIIPVRLCEGSYFFRDHELERTGTYYFTTYWTQTGCDTLWQFDLVTCPHCRWYYDTVAPDQLPVVFNDRSFGSECHDEPVHLHINDTCDSIIYYTLIVIPHWGEPPIDSTWITAPNVFTPTLDANTHFALSCSPHILQAEVTVFNRMGIRVAHFDGLTGSWDGRKSSTPSSSGGAPCPQGSYVYIVRYIDTHDANWKVFSGTVTLLR